MESNEHTELTSKTETDSEREQADSCGVERSSKKGKGLMDSDSSVVTVVGEVGYKGVKW